MKFDKLLEKYDAQHLEAGKENAKLNKTLIENHISMQWKKFYFGIIIYVLVGIALSINTIYPNTFDTKLLGWIAVSVAMVMSSTKIKSMKDILNLK